MIVSMKRKIFISILICVLAIASIFSCGYQAILAIDDKTDYLYGKDFDGQIVEQVVVSIDNNTYSPQQKQDIKWTARNIINQKLIAYKANVNSMILSARSNEHRALLQQMLDGVEFSSPDWDEETGEFFVNVTFLNETAYLWFYNVLEKNFKQTTTTEKWLYYTIHYTGNIDYMKNVGLFNLLSTSESLTSIFPEIANSQLSYSYLTQSGRYHSNADSITRTTDGYVHTWNATSENKEIEFHLNIAHRQNWYILAIIIGLSCALILGVVALIIVIIKHNKRKRLIYRMINRQNNL